MNGPIECLVVVSLWAKTPPPHSRSAWRGIGTGAELRLPAHCASEPFCSRWHFCLQTGSTQNNCLHTCWAMNCTQLGWNWCLPSSWEVGGLSAARHSLDGTWAQSLSAQTHHCCPGATDDSLAPSTQPRRWLRAHPGPVLHKVAAGSTSPDP